MAHPVGPNDLHLICSRDLDCNSKIINSFCDRNSSCACDRGYRYFNKFNKCVFSNHFHCTSVQQCANLDPRLTCGVDSYCTCKEKEKRIDNYLCSSFKRYCYKGYVYNTETTDCVFVGDLTVNQLENLDQSVEIFVIVLFFITSALFIISCINNYKNERAEKLRRRLARQQTMSLFAEQQRRMDLNGSPSMTGGLANENLFASHHQQRRNGPPRSSMTHNLSMNQNRNFRQHPHLMDSYHKAMSEYDDLPPSYEEVMKNEDNSKLYLNPLANTMLTLNTMGQLTSAPPVRELNAVRGPDLAIQLDADNPTERGGQSSDANHPEQPHPSDANHPNHLTQANNSTDGRDDELANKAASNNAVCQAIDTCSSPNWDTLNNNDPNNNHSLAAR